MLGLIILAVARILRLLINLYTFIVAISVLISWVSPDPYNPIVRFLRQVTEPAFYQIRKRLPRSALHWKIDISPIILFMLLIIIDTILVGWLFDLASQLR